MHAPFQTVIQVFVRVQIRRIRGKIEYLYQLPVLFKPFLDGGAMMDSQIVQNQKDLSPGSLDQSLHECDQKIAMHRFAIDHETDLPAIGNCRNHADTVLLRTEGSNRSDS